VLFVHGGPVPPDLPLAPKDWGVYEGYGALAAASGLVGVTFNHRYFRLADLETAAGDVAGAIAYARAHADELGLDPDRLCLWAFSGGGPLLTPFLEESRPYLRCLVAYYAALDLRGLPRRVPFLVARAGLDGPGLNGSIDRFVREALAANVDLTLLNHPRGHHGFDTRDDDPRTRGIVAILGTSG
jgi:dienelactone hydrolase